ncbi:hypothetical protein GCM10009641_86480 [Mycobacterium cookii]|uniref:Uncharacterized protein n=1 Tax=Nocardioides furvisabuli TaxID=375542 RepID=A0ABP5IFA7_9ACTN|nr:hypothetical protein [Nocardioides furvisabuli]
MDAGLWVTSCDTDTSLAVAARLFDLYRRHYGESTGMRSPQARPGCPS